MNLATALRLDSKSRLALVGAGGKTSALFMAGRALSQHLNPDKPVLLTTTTHLAQEQSDQADHFFKLHSPDDVTTNLQGLTSGVILLTGNQTIAGRIKGPEPEVLEAIFELVELRDWPLLVEADGARLRPLKAPAGHEPVIPGWANQVLVCAGLSGLGKPLDDKSIHRPEIYTKLAGLDPGNLITSQAIARVLSHPSGGLKGILPHTRRIALLNQADTAEKQAVARRMANQLLAVFEAVIISSLNPPQDEPAIHVAIEKTAGVILAAGSASRYGQPKQLLTWQGETFVHRAARIALEAGLNHVLVVTGAYGDQVKQAIADLPVECVFNSAWETGQGASVATAVQALPPGTGAAVFLLADQPQVPVSLISSLTDAHSTELNPIIGPLIDGQRGNPVLFDRVTFKDLSQLHGETGGKAIFSRFPVRWIPWHDGSVRLDIDTPADFDRLIE